MAQSGIEHLLTLTLGKSIEDAAEGTHILFAVLISSLVAEFVEKPSIFLLCLVPLTILDLWTSMQQILPLRLGIATLKLVSRLGFLNPIHRPGKSWSSGMASQSSGGKVVGRQMQSALECSCSSTRRQRCRTWLWYLWPLRSCAEPAGINIHPHRSAICDEASSGESRIEQSSRRPIKQEKTCSGFEQDFVADTQS